MNNTSIQKTNNNTTITIKTPLQVNNPLSLKNIFHKTLLLSDNSKNIILENKSFKKEDFNSIMAEIKDFTTFLSIELKKLGEESEVNYASQIQELSSFNAHKVLNTPFNSIQMSPTLSKLKENILNIIKHVSDKDLSLLTLPVKNYLSEKKYLSCFKNIFSEIKIYQQIDHRIPSEDTQKNIFLKNTCNVLIHLDNLEKAIETAFLITGNDSLKSSILQHISTLLIDAEAFEMATLAISGIPSEDIINQSLPPLCISLASTGNIAKACEMVRKVSVETIRTETLKQMCISLAQLGKIEAIEIAFTLPKNHRMETLDTACSLLIKPGTSREESNLREFEKLVSTMKDKDNKSWIEKNICNFYARRGATERATKLSANIINKAAKNLAIFDICNQILTTKNFQNALALCYKISDNSLQIDILKNFFDKLIETQTIDTVLNKSLSIQNKKVIDDVLQNICVSLTERGRISEAVAIVYNISNEEKRTQTLQNVCLSLQKLRTKEGPLTDETFNEILSVLFLISNDHDKDYVFQKISISLAESGYREQAVQTAYNIGDGAMQVQTLKDVCTSLAKSGDIAMAFATADFTTGDDKKWILRSLCSSTVKAGHLETVLNEISFLTDSNEISWALESVCEQLAKSGNIEEAIKLVFKIPYDKNRSWALDYICKKLLKAGNIKKALGLILLIPDNITKNLALNNICIILKPLAIEEIIITTSSLLDNDKCFVFENICEQLWESGDIEKAINLASYIPNQNNQDSVFENICLSLIENGQIELASNIAYNISDDSIKNLISKRIEDTKQAVTMVTVESAYIEKQKEVEKVKEEVPISIATKASDKAVKNISKKRTKKNSRKRKNKSTCNSNNLPKPLTSPTYEIQFEATLVQKDAPILANQNPIKNVKIKAEEAFVPLKTNASLPHIKEDTLIKKEAPALATQDSPKKIKNEVKQASSKLKTFQAKQKVNQTQSKNNLKLIKENLAPLDNTHIASKDPEIKNIQLPEFRYWKNPLKRGTLIKILSENGWAINLKRGKGSHALATKNNTTLVIPSQEIIKKGTLGSLQRLIYEAYGLYKI